MVTDFSKAFDCVDHIFAIQKLCDLGVRSEIIPWIADFLASRRQRVQYRSALSEWRSSPVVFLRALSLAPSFSLLSSRGGSTYSPNRHRPTFWQMNHANSVYFRLFLGYFRVISATRPPPFGSRPLLFTYPGSTPALINDASENSNTHSFKYVNDLSLAEVHPANNHSNIDADVQHLDA